ncbi:MAG TPA: type I glyceraldehyde-3-phosphate dehydrogenase [Bacilli bacterium]|nr:type I glyceraldehyde-3-phosphate dehydrogenase [Bacilli bacterium]HQC84055.1 type I glyceraldehyde-3-phosphate dehydrogenase [Bacilli bacterium]
MKKIAINGFGRIGRLAFRELMNDDELEVVAINDLAPVEDLYMLLKYDSNFRMFNSNGISFNDKGILFKGRLIKVYKEVDASKLPWKEEKIDVVLECSGHYTKVEDAMKHISAGAKHVVISAPAKGDCKTIVYNVNHETLTGKEEIISAASCTTNCLAPVLDVLDRTFGVECGFMTTIHATTNDQTTLDVVHKKGCASRRGRSAMANIIPTSTGAASAIGKVMPQLDGKLMGGAMRVPTIDGSMIDLSLVLKKKVSVDDINEAFRINQNKTIEITHDPIVSCDVIGHKTGALVDGELTEVLDVDGKQMVKVIAWYDNELGYTNQMIRTMKVLI